MDTRRASAASEHWQPSEKRGQIHGTSAESAVVVELRVEDVAPELETSGDDTPVSSETRASGEVAALAPDYGQAGPPNRIEGETGIEPEPRYRPNWGMAGWQPNQNGEASIDVESDIGQLVTSEPPVLDAWYATLPALKLSGANRRPEIARSIAEAAQNIAEVVIGMDDRVPVNTTGNFPWRCVCALNIFTGDGQSFFIGTGFLVGPRTVITAGHCVYMHLHGGWARRIEVIPGANGAQAPFDRSTSKSFRSVRGWVDGEMRTHDYGAIILPEAARLGEQTGTFGLADLDEVTLSALTVNLSGYPGDKPRQTQWFHARPVQSVTDRTIIYSIDTAGGQSGSPVWRLKDSERHVVGIHTNGDSTGNSATRIAKPVFDNIRRWVNEGA